MKARPLSITIAAVIVLLAANLLAGCAAPTPAPKQGLQVLAVESFLADITQNVAGERATVQTLIPAGLDPHAFEPTPQDMTRIANSQVLVLNGAGFEAWAEETLANAGGQRQVIIASQGLTPREAELEDEEEHEGEEEAGKEDEHGYEGDPHFWFNPQYVVFYVENIRDGLSQADPAGAEIYARNAAAYIEELRVLDHVIEQALSAIPAELRLLVTNHESLGYYADRYGLTVVGTVLPGTSSGVMPSAADMAALIESIRSSGAPAIFMETGANSEMAEQIAAETGIKVVTDLYTHSLSAADGPAAGYLSMMRHNTALIVEALK